MMDDVARRIIDRAPPLRLVVLTEKLHSPFNLIAMFFS